jgi:putative flippase GtrA
MTSHKPFIPNHVALILYPCLIALGVGILLAALYVVYKLAMLLAKAGGLGWGLLAGFILYTIFKKPKPQTVDWNA